MCISSLAQVHGILTVGCRQGCLIQRFHWAKREPTRRQDDKCGAVVCNFAPRGQMIGGKNACKCLLHILFHCRTMLHESPRQNMLKMCQFLYSFSLSAMQTLPLIPLLLCDSTIWKKFGSVLLEIVLKISSAKMISRLTWCCVLSKSRT